MVRSVRMDSKTDLAAIISSAPKLINPSSLSDSAMIAPARKDILIQNPGLAMILYWQTIDNHKSN